MRKLLCVSLLPFVPQELARYAGGNMLPREHLVLASLARSIKVLIEASFGERLQPTLVIKAIAPAIKTRALLPCSEQRLTHLAVTASKYGFNNTGLAIVIVERYILNRFNLVLQEELLATNVF